MDSIYVTMLGSFDIIVEGKSTLPYIGNSPKGILLLKYLLLNRGKPVPVTVLIDTFWSEPDKSNPESALKTMVSRLRHGLAKAHPVLKDCILSEKKAYRWNAEVPCAVDVFQFEDLCHELEKASGLTGEVQEKFLRMQSLYGGDLSYTSDEDWIVGRSLYLHHLYIKIVRQFIELLKKEQEYETVIKVCRVALDIDNFDEGLNLELMNALREGGQSSAALMQYRYFTNAYYRYLGMDPSEKVLGFYKSLIKADLAAKADINSIRRELQAAGEQGGAFVCEYSIFRDIYQLQVRNLERNKNKMFLALFSVNSPLHDALDPLVLDTVMKDLLDILKQCLRKGDTITRYSSTQYAILLPMLSYLNGNIVINRIREMFYRKESDKNIKLSVQFGGVEEE